MLTGRCLCEKISYEIKGKLGPIYNCHCSKCRRWHGAAFRTRATIKASQFTWLSGLAFLKRYNSSDNVIKTFCSNCGSPLMSFYNDDPDIIGVPLGGLEQDPGHRPIGHIFAQSKSPWYDINDGLPQYKTWPGSQDAVRKTKDG